MKNALLIIFSSLVLFMSCLWQQEEADVQGSTLKPESPIEFNYKYKDKYHDSVELIVFNKSDKMKFFSIAVGGLTDTGWIGLTADINSLGSNDFWGLTAIAPKEKITKLSSKKRIFYLYDYYNISEIKFSLMYFEKKEISNDYRVIELDPMRK